MSVEERKAGEGYMPRADLLTAIVFIVLGLTVAYFSWTMPRLENRGVHPATIPGLVPGFLGLALAVSGAILGIGAWAGRDSGSWGALLGLLATRQALKVGALLALAFFYTLVLVGWLPFGVATAIFVTAFILVFEVVLGDPPIPLMKSLVWALPIGVLTGVAIVIVFERLFLVRLP